MSLAIYSLDLSLVEVLIWLHLWLMMCFLIVRNVDHLSIHVRWTLRVLLTQCRTLLFLKKLYVVPDHCWRVMVHWYRSITVRIKWNGKLSDSIKVCKGTRQGGLSSPFLFNLFYQDLINGLSNSADGIKIKNVSYNVFCYADDILLASLTVTGSQKWIGL